MDTAAPSLEVRYEGIPYRVFGHPSIVMGRLVYRAENLLNGFKTVVPASFVWGIYQ